MTTNTTTVNKDELKGDQPCMEGKTLLKNKRKGFLSLLLRLALLLGIISGMTLTACADNNQIGTIIYSDQGTFNLGGASYCTHDQNNHINVESGTLCYSQYTGGQHQFEVRRDNGGTIFIYITDSDSRRPYGIQVTSGSGTSGDPYKFKVLIHNHNLDYGSPADTITITCTNTDHCSLPNQTATLSLTAPTDLIYNGSAKTVTVVDSGSFLDSVQSDSRATIVGVQYYNKIQQTYSNEAKDVGQYRAYYYIDVRYSSTYTTKYSAFVDFDISPKEVRISAKNSSKKYGSPDPVLTASVVGNVAGENLNYSIKRETGENIGEYAITVINGSNPNYSVKTDAAIFTIERVNSAVTLPPSAKALTYNGTAQEIINAGTATGGEMQYALGTNATTAPTAEWSTAIPKGTDAGTYYVWYKVVGDKNHLDFAPACVTATISDNKTTYVVAFVDNGVHEIGDRKDCRITVQSEPDGSKAFDNYQNTRMDSTVMPNGSHTAEKGSLILTLKDTYLDTLAIGKHKVTINFKDGSVDVDITVKEGYVVPKTGDSADLMLWLGLMLMGLLTAGVILVSGKMRNIRK